MNSFSTKNSPSKVPCWRGDDRWEFPEMGFQGADLWDVGLWYEAGRFDPSCRRFSGGGLDDVCWWWCDSQIFPRKTLVCDWLFYAMFDVWRLLRIQKSCFFCVTDFQATEAWQEQRISSNVRTNIVEWLCARKVRLCWCEGRKYNCFFRLWIVNLKSRRRQLTVEPQTIPCFYKSWILQTRNYT